MADLATLQTWLTEAETARHQLVTGSKHVSLSFSGGAGDNKSVAYATFRNQLDKLDAYIASLRAQIAALEGSETSRTRPINLTF
jgi:hypothetical protein